MPITQGGTWSPDPRIVSPGVFTRENDLSGLAQGVADIGAAIVAPFPKGPGFAPTLVTDSNTLQNTFGVPDGVYYGPYTAQEYLIQKGFVTVCRVGALTGYHQKYPFVIYAIKGQWNRAQDAGWSVPGIVTGPSSTLNVAQALISSSSYTNPSFTTFVSNSIGADSSSSGITGSWYIPNIPAMITFAGVGATGNVADANHSNGSVVYNQQTVSIGNISVYLPISTSVAYPLTGSNDARDAYLASVLAQSAGWGLSGSTVTSTTTTIYVSSASFVGSPVAFGSQDLSVWSNNGSGADPFSRQTIMLANTMSIVKGVCAGYTYYIEGLVSGSLGNYDGTFTGATPTYNVCSQSWTTGSSEYKILAVLANTQQSVPDKNLVAWGFSGSVMTTASAVSGTSGPLPSEFNLTLQQTTAFGPIGTYNFSINPGSTKYITSVFGNDPTAGNPAQQVAGAKVEAAYLYNIFNNRTAQVYNDPGHWYVSGSVLPNGLFSGEPLNFTDQYSLNLNNGDSAFALTNASTPWVVSQQISPWNGGTPVRFELFKFFTIGDGTYTNTQIKIEINNIKLASTVAGSNWGTFNVVVRSYSDTDRRPVILEQFTNVTLDPTAANFIARAIGDRYNYINSNGKILQFGTYDNQSKYVYVQMTNINYPVSAVPYGFEAYATPIDSSAGYWTPRMTFTKASVYGPAPGKYPSGINFDDAPTGADTELFSLYPTASAGVGTAQDNEQYFAPVPAFDGSGGAYVSVGRNYTFAMDVNITDGGVGYGSYLSASNVVPAVVTPQETTYVKMRRFVFGFQGGFDGQSPAIPINIGGNILPGNTQGLDCTNINSAGSIAYKQCIGALGNAAEFDINMIVTPGIVDQYHPYVTTLTTDMCEARGDCFYIVDFYVDSGNPSSGQIDQVVSLAQNWDTNYAATYYPWVKIRDTNTNDIVTVPPSVLLPAVFAANDKVAGEWWAAAGLNRGGITQAIMVTDRTTQPERDTLYENRINPIAQFPGQGIVVWGQKTLQVKNSALNRINVRRLLIEIKKYFASTARYLVFEQNTAATRNKFLAIANPYLQSIQQRSGLYAFQIKMDETNNTPDLIDQNVLYGQIYLQPTRTSEYIQFDFNILPSGGGATFSAGA